VPPAVVLFPAWFSRVNCTKSTFNFEDHPNVSFHTCLNFSETALLGFMHMPHVTLNFAHYFHISMSFVKPALTVYEWLSHCFHILSLQSTPVQRDECLKVSLDYEWGDSGVIEGSFFNWLRAGELNCFLSGAVSLSFLSFTVCSDTVWSLLGFVISYFYTDTSLYLKTIFQ
jgi:hypothetical protein